MNGDLSSAVNTEKDFSFKKTEIKSFAYLSIKKLFNIKNILVIIIIFLSSIILIQRKTIFNLKKSSYNDIITNKNNNDFKYNINFNYEDYDKEIITDKIIKNSGFILSLKEAQFINGLIRKNKLKNCLEIGVAHGGSSALILNSIKDIENSLLVSLDLNKEMYNNKNKLTGYRVKKFFPELAKNWKLYTGDQAHKFLIKLNMKFDFLFLDSAHVSPGEILNFIEALPFLNENAIVVVHDLFWHFGKVIRSKFYPSCISLIPAIFGDKVFINQRNKSISNIGAVFLHSNQKKHYLDYFLLLLNFWEYIPTDTQINDLRVFINKYYKDKIYINIFDTAVRKNKQVHEKFIKYNNIYEEKKYLVSLGYKWNISHKNL